MRHRRHDLLDVAPDAWAAVVGGLALPADAATVVAGWSRRGRPVIVRRRLTDDAEDTVPVALQLPNAVGRLRLALSLPVGAVAERPRLDLAEAAKSAPPAWAKTIATLLALGESFGAAAVYGGLLWQHVTGEPVLRPGSDLDLLWQPAASQRLALLTELDALDGAPVRVDGEIVLEDGGGVAWRELHAAAAAAEGMVAVKTMEGVALRPASAILHGETLPC